MSASTRSSPNTLPLIPHSNQDQKYNIIGYPGALLMPHTVEQPIRTTKFSRRSKSSKQNLSPSETKRWSAAPDAIPDTAEWMSRSSRSSAKKIST